MALSSYLLQNSSYFGRYYNELPGNNAADKARYLSSDDTANNFEAVFQDVRKFIAYKLDKDAGSERFCVRGSVRKGIAMADSDLDIDLVFSNNSWKKELLLKVKVVFYYYNFQWKIGRGFRMPFIMSTVHTALVEECTMCNVHKIKMSLVRLN